VYLDASFEHAPVAIAVLDRELRFLRVNRMHAGLSRRDPADYPGRTTVDLTGEEVARPIIDLMNEVLATGVAKTGLRFVAGPREWEYSVHPWRNAAGEVGGVVCYTGEITQQLRIDHELASNRVQLEEAQAIAQIGSWDADLVTGTIAWSREARRIFGVEDHETPSYELFMQRVHPEDRATVARITERVVETAMPADFEHRLLLPSGEQRAIVSHNRAIVDDHGRVVRLIGTNQDVTERRHMERRLAVQDRMSALGSLAAGLAHEINNPLSFVLGNADLALEQVGALRDEIDRFAMTSDQRQPLLDRLAQLAALVGDSRDGGARVRAIVGDMKTFARGDDSGNNVPVDLRRIADSTANLATNEIRHRARLVRDLGPVPPVLGSDSRLGEVVLNLLVNAAQAIPDGEIAEHEVRIVTRTDRLGCAVLEVRDTGCGIPPAIIKNIFDPFFTTKPIGSGSTGLGLAICHSIVESLGGELTVESEPGKGSLFRVVLPPTVERAQLQRSERIPVVTRRGRVLIIDDEPMVVAFTGRCLREHDVIGVTDASDALTRIGAGEQFDVILCDLMMPNITGIDFFERVGAQRPELAGRIVFMTGGTFTPRAQRFLDSVANPCIEKPFAPPALRALVRERVG
jgi:PAS domain S-box-containing protein